MACLLSCCRCKLVANTALRIFHDAKRTYWCGDRTHYRGAVGTVAVVISNALSAAHSATIRAAVLAAAISRMSWRVVPLRKKRTVADTAQPHIAIVTAYNDMLSAHVPYASYPAQLKAALTQVQRNRTGGGRCACDVRWRHAGSRWHGARIIQSRCHRVVNGGVAFARCVRRACCCSVFATRSFPAC